MQNFRVIRRLLTMPLLVAVAFASPSVCCAQAYRVLSADEMTLATPRPADMDHPCTGRHDDTAGDSSQESQPLCANCTGGLAPSSKHRRSECNITLAEPAVVNPIAGLTVQRGAGLENSASACPADLMLRPRCPDAIVGTAGYDSEFPAGQSLYLIFSSFLE